MEWTYSLASYLGGKRLVMGLVDAALDNECWFAKKRDDASADEHLQHY